MINNSKNTLHEETRFILLNNIMESEIRIGKTLFIVGSRFNEGSAIFRDTISDLLERKICILNSEAG